VRARPIACMPGGMANLEKAIEIKRRAQRFIQSGNLDGALNEYERLVTLEDVDPYNFVLLADLLYKRGDMPGAVERYLTAASAYEKTHLHKNAIAVCKKMMRLSLSPVQVLERLALLHALEGLGTEASLYYQQFAENLMRENRTSDAAAALRKAYQATPEEVELLERAAELHGLADEGDAAALALAEAGHAYHQRGMEKLSKSCRERAEQAKPGVLREYEVQYLLASGASPHQEPEARAGSEEDEDDRSVGPPLLPALRDEEAETAAPGGDPGGFERFPVHAGRGVGLQFEAPGTDGAGPGSPLLSAEEIEATLQQAQEKMRNGDHEGAAATLAEAAHAYEAVGRHDNAATIYRSVSKSPASTLDTLKEWLANCERRDDHREAGEVACELGDRAIGRGDNAEATEWFERALRFDKSNAHAQRRLQRLDQMKRAAEAGPPAIVAQAAPAAEAHTSKVELALGRSEAVSFDLGALLSEFQRGIEAQLSGDAQGHYDLAMAYREMGLVDHAIESFRMALSNPVLGARATEMLGRCLLDQGQFEDAAQELTAVLERPDLDADAELGLRYLLGLAYEAGGRSQDALREFEQLQEAQPGFQDVAQKVRDLRKSPGIA